MPTCGIFVRGLDPQVLLNLLEKYSWLLKADVAPTALEPNPRFLRNRTNFHLVVQNYLNPIHQTLRNDRDSCTRIVASEFHIIELKHLRLLRKIAPCRDQIPVSCNASEFINNLRRRNFGLARAVVSSDMFCALETVE